MISNIEEIRDFYIEVKRTGISIGRCIQGYRTFQMMKHLGIIDDDDDDDENKIGNINTIKDPNSNNKINFNEFSSFVNSIYLYCKNNGIELQMVFSLIHDLHQFMPRSSALPKLSNTINYSSSNNMEISLPHSNQNEKII